MNVLKKFRDILLRRTLREETKEPRPKKYDRAAWKEYWQKHGQLWRTEPEIDQERQQKLALCLRTIPNKYQGRYPFQDMPLTRADIEWLLATHENGMGPVVWGKEEDRKREGIDVRGADLRKVNLSDLPLARLQGGLCYDESGVTKSELYAWAAVHLDGAILSGTHLEGAILNGAHLNGAFLRHARLEHSQLYGAHLEQASLPQASLSHTKLQGAYLQEANLSDAHLEHADLAWAHLSSANLSGAQLQRGSLMLAHMECTLLHRAQLEEASLPDAYLEGAFLAHACLKNAILVRVSLRKATLVRAHLEGAKLENANLEDAILDGAFLEGANLSRARLSGAKLEDISLSGKQKVGPLLVDVDWGTTVLSSIEWSQVQQLGEEYQARQKKEINGKQKDLKTRLEQYQRAIRANRQLAVALQSQGLNEDASRFAYRAQVLQRKVLWKQHHFWKWLGSATLALLAGYGYRMWCIIVAYLFIVLLCAVAYFVLGMYYEPHLSFLDAVFTSITAFHGRVFSEPFLHPGAPQLWVTAFEAVMGLVIEGVFIAMLTQKFFGK